MSIVDEIKKKVRDAGGTVSKSNTIESNLKALKFNKLLIGNVESHYDSEAQKTVYSSDMTFDEMRSAINDGCYIILIHDSSGDGSEFYYYGLSWTGPHDGSSDEEDGIYFSRLNNPNKTIIAYPNTDWMIP